MIAKKVKQRNFFVKGTPLPDRAKDTFSHRRESPTVMMESEEFESDKYDTFFEYEDDLANLKASGEQYADMVSEDPYVILEERLDLPDDKQEEESPSKIGAFVMEENLEVIEKQEDKSYKDVVGFEFVQCSFIKKDGHQCKRQAPKGATICSVHKKYKEKHNQ